VARRPGRSHRSGRFETYSFPQWRRGPGGTGGAAASRTFSQHVRRRRAAWRTAGWRRFVRKRHRRHRLDLDLNVAMTCRSRRRSTARRNAWRLPTGKSSTSKVPAGVTAGQQIASKARRNRARHRPGAPHYGHHRATPVFKVDGSDLRVDLPITLYEAVLAASPGADARQRGRPHDPQEHLERADFSPEGQGFAKGAGATGDLFITTESCCPMATTPTGGVDAEMGATRTPTIPRSDFG